MYEFVGPLVHILSNCRVECSQTRKDRVERSFPLCFQYYTPYFMPINLTSPAWHRRAKTPHSKCTLWGQKGVCLGFCNAPKSGGVGCWVQPPDIYMSWSSICVTFFDPGGFIGRPSGFYKTSSWTSYIYIRSKHCLRRTGTIFWDNLLEDSEVSVCQISVLDSAVNKDSELSHKAQLESPKEQWMI